MADTRGRPVDFWVAVVDPATGERLGRFVLHGEAQAPGKSAGGAPGPCAVDAAEALRLREEVRTAAATRGIRDPQLFGLAADCGIELLRKCADLAALRRLLVKVNDFRGSAVARG